MKNLINQFIKNEDGVTAIEYSIIGVSMAVVLSAIFAPGGKIGTSLTSAFGKIATALDGTTIKS